MDGDEKRRAALEKVIAPMGKEELKVIAFYIRLLDEVDDEDAWYLFRKLISDSAHHLTLDTEMLLQLAPSARTKSVPRGELKSLASELDRAELYEREAYEMYDRALPSLDDPYMRQTARWIRDEEAKHIQMVRELKRLIRRKISKK